MYMKKTTRLPQSLKPRSKGLFLLASMLLTSSFSTCALAANALESVRYTSLPGNRLEIRMQMAETTPPPRSFTINNPARISMDLMDTQNKLDKRNIPIGLGAVRSINTVEAAGRTRVVFNLSSMVPHKISQEGQELIVTLDAEGSKQAMTPSATHATQLKSGGSEIKRKAIAPHMLKNIDFRRGEKGEGRVILDLSSNSVPTDVTREDGKTVITLVGADSNNELLRRLDVLDFATPIKFIDVFRSGGNIRIVIEPSTQDFRQMAYQSDNLFTVELKPVPREQIVEENKKKFGYSGKRLSLNFQDIEIRSVLQLLADFTGLNIVVSDSVSGKLTLRLKDVPWDQALDIILRSEGLAKRESGNVMLIAPTEEIATRERIELEAHQQVQELTKLRTEFLQINYAKATAMMEIIKSDNNSILSERGSAAVDERTNTLMVHDTEEKLTAVRAMISRLDIPVRQVLIESRIVVASDDFNKELGVRFGVNRDTRKDGEGSVVSGTLEGITNHINDEKLGNPDRFNINLPTTNQVGTLALAFATQSGALLELELSAMQAEGRGEVISSPRVITANQKEAFIEQGVEIPYLEASSSGAATISFRKAVLGLKVTPQITPDDRVIMDLTVNKDSVGELFGQGDNRIPSIDTREINTQVLVNNGETVVLGGIYEQVIRNETSRVPFFSDLPLIGRLFKHTNNEDDKTELLVFVTPKIIKDSSQLNY